MAMLAAARASAPAPLRPRTALLHHCSRRARAVHYHLRRAIMIKDGGVVIVDESPALMPDGAGATGARAVERMKASNRAR